MMFYIFYFHSWDDGMIYVHLLDFKALKESQSVAHTIHSPSIVSSLVHTNDSLLYKYILVRQQFEHCVY